MLASTNDSPKRLAPLNSPDLKREVMPTTFFFFKSEYDAPKRASRTINGFELPCASSRHRGQPGLLTTYMITGPSAQSAPERRRNAIISISDLKIREMEEREHYLTNQQWCPEFLSKRLSRQASTLFSQARQQQTFPLEYSRFSLRSTTCSVLIACGEESGQMQTEETMSSLS